MITYEDQNSNNSKEGEEEANTVVIDSSTEDKNGSVLQLKNLQESELTGPNFSESKGISVLDNIQAALLSIR
jgi:hypothetical protein